MVLYHATDRHFRKVGVDKRVMNEDTLVEGLGLYVSYNPAEINKLGKYLYQLYVPDNEIQDFRDVEVLREHINSTIPSRVDKYIGPFQKEWIVLTLAEGSVLGGNSIVKIPQLIIYELYRDKRYAALASATRSKIECNLRSLHKKSLKTYFFNYKGYSSLGVIKKYDNIRIINVQ